MPALIPDVPRCSFSCALPVLGTNHQSNCFITLLFLAVVVIRSKVMHGRHLTRSERDLKHCTKVTAFSIYEFSCTGPFLTLKFCDLSVSSRGTVLILFHSFIYLRAARGARALPAPQMRHPTRHTTPSPSFIRVGSPEELFRFAPPIRPLSCHNTSVSPDVSLGGGRERKMQTLV